MSLNTKQAYSMPQRHLKSFNVWHDIINEIRRLVGYGGHCLSLDKEFIIILVLNLELQYGTFSTF